MKDAGLGREPAVVKPFPEPPRFLADVMVGSLARWLRLLGFDTLYGPEFDDDALARMANLTGRILLTADRALAARPAVRHPLLVPPSGLDLQLRAVARSIPLLPLSRPLTRCPVCNAPLSSLPRDRARDRVPPYVFDAHEAFLSCVPCGRVFWPGTHRDHIIGWMQEHIGRGALPAPVPIPPMEQCASSPPPHDRHLPF